MLYTHFKQTKDQPSTYQGVCYYGLFLVIGLETEN